MKKYSIKLKPKFPLQNTLLAASKSNEPLYVGDFSSWNSQALTESRNVRKRACRTAQSSFRDSFGNKADKAGQNHPQLFPSKSIKDYENWQKEHETVRNHLQHQLSIKISKR